MDASRRSNVTSTSQLKTCIPKARLRTDIVQSEVEVPGVIQGLQKTFYVATVFSSIQ